MSNEFLPYGRQAIDDDDIEAVTRVLRSDFLTTGPAVQEFEQAVASIAGTEHAVALANGTAALHGAMHALDLEPGDEVIVPSLTFAATANAVLFERARPAFADVDPGSLLIDPASAEERISEKTRAIIAVDYAGQPCDYDALQDLCEDHELTLVADACHSIGASYRGRPVGSLAELSCFSFHPVKHITTGEGGMVVTDDESHAERIRRFRNHGLNLDHQQRNENQTYRYDMVTLGYNYRLSDIHCALGVSQLRKLKGWIEKRQEIAGWYGEALAKLTGIEPLTTHAGASHAYHIFVVRIDSETTGVHRDEVYDALRQRSIGSNVHYIPTHLHPYYQEKLGTGPGDCPVAEAAYDEILTLPLFPRMTEGDVSRVVRALDEVTA